jgi:hypothetical protein
MTQNITDLSKEELVDLLNNATEFAFNAIPVVSRDEYGEWSAWSITVARRAEGKWAVVGNTGILNKSGSWEHEKLPSARTEKFIARTRFSLPVAVELAKKAAESVTINGLTPDGYIKWNRAREIVEEESRGEELTPHDHDQLFYDTLLTLDPDEPLMKHIALVKNARGLS